MKIDKVRTRIAPSPTGYPHVGTIYQALLDKAFAVKNNGKFIVRIEDTDSKRFVEGAEEKMYEALDWFGLTEDESPRKGGPFKPYKQSERLDIYQKYAEELIDKNKAYYCFCSSERLDEVRKQQQKEGKPPMYDKHCRNIPKEEAEKRVNAGESYVIRMAVPENETIVVNDLVRGKMEYPSNSVDDQVIIKSDGFPTYHLAHIVDDHLMEITHVIRGHGWIPSSPKHKLLYDYLGWEMPVLLHTPDLLNMESKGKLSKRQGHSSVIWYQEQGFLPEAVLNFLALLGWAPPSVSGQSKESQNNTENSMESEIFSFNEFVKLFDLKDLRTSNPKFDIVKLEWLNGQYIKKLSLDEFYNRILSFNPKFTEYNAEKFKKVLSLVQERVRKLIEVEDLITYFFNTPTNYEEIRDLALKESKESLENTQKQIGKVIEILKNITDWKAENIDSSLHELMEKESINPRQFFMPIRIIVTGRAFSPPLGDTLELIGKEETLERLQAF